jgi:apolipoprotein N-acyltransferase
VLGGQVGVFSRHLRLTETIHPGPSLVLWPEDVVALSGPLAGSPKAAALAAQALRLHATVLAGVTEPVGSTRFLNEVVAWSPSGRIIGRYEKVHRVPFGEYVPDRAFFSHLVSLADVPRDAIPGHGPGFLRTPAGPLGIMISYEVFFSSRSRPAVAAGAEVLLVPTNTASYTTSQIPTQELAASRLRAVEEGRNLVQVSPTGFSAFVSPSGTVSQRSNLGKPALIEATVPLRRGETIFQRLGPHPWLALLGLLLVLGWVLGAVADATAAPGTPAETS